MSITSLAQVGPKQERHVEHCLHSVINIGFFTNVLRWKVKDPPAKNGHLDQDLSTELVKVMWCHGVTYRYVCSKLQARFGETAEPFFCVCGESLYFFKAKT